MFDRRLSSFVVDFMLFNRDGLGTIKAHRPRYPLLQVGHSITVPNVVEGTADGEPLSNLIRPGFLLFYSSTSCRIYDLVFHSSLF